MPTLKQLTCRVEWSGNNLPLQEFHTTYGDGFVHTYIAVPPIQTPFSVHLTSQGYIASGLAMFVYMDGEYQCNRNRRNLKIPNASTKPKQTEIDFRVRQKEELQPDHTFRGQQWKFKELNIVSDVNETCDNPAPHNAEYVGTIEVVVLRCRPVEGNDSFKKAATPATPKRQPERVNYVYPGVSSDSASGNDDTASESGSDSGFGGLFDGPCDVSSNRLPSMAFGGDATWDDGENGDNGARNIWNQGNNAPASSQEWNLAIANNRGPPQWDTRASSTSNHFTDDWNKPSQGTQEPENGHGTYNSGDHNEWLDGNTSQPSPAIIINVNHPSANIGPPSVASSWKTRSLPGNLQSSFDTNQAPQGHNNSPNGSNRSGSNKSGSSNGSKKYNGGNSWQATAGPNDTWGTEAQHMPGAWDASNDNPQGNTWNNDNANTGWNSDYHRQNDHGQHNDNNWNNGGANGGWQGTSGDGLNEQPQTNQWTNEQMTAAYPDWASPTAQNHERPNPANSNNNVQPQNPWGTSGSNGQAPANHQSTWPNENAGLTNNNGGVSAGNGDKQSLQEQNSKGSKTNDVAGDVPVALFGGKVPVPASESAKREGPILAKHLNNGTGFTFGAQSPAVQHPLGMSIPYTPMSAPVAGFAKPYWSTWNHAPAAEEELMVEPEPVEEPEEPEGPVYSVPADVAQRSNMSHQVQVGRPTVYLHKTSKPKYMDTHDNPYAAFTFQYRSREVIEKMFGVSLAETQEEEKERLSSLSKEELIEEYLKAKASKNSEKSSSSSNDSKKQNKVTNAGLGFGGELAQKLAQLKAESKDSGDRMSIDPELHWDRPAPHGDNAGWNNGAATTNENVTGWLTNGGGGGIANSPVTSPPQNGPDDNNDGNGGNSWSRNNQQSGSGAQPANQWTENHGNGAGGHNGSAWNGGNGNNRRTQYGAPWNGNGNSWNNGNHGNNEDNNEHGKPSSWNNDGRGDRQGGSMRGSGSGNPQNGYTALWNNNSGGNQGGGSLNDGGQGSPTQGAWKGNNQSGNSWVGGGSGGRGQNNWNNGGQGNTSSNAAGGEASAGGNAGETIQW